MNIEAMAQSSAEKQGGEQGCRTECPAPTPSEGRKPVVSVCTITYNHAPYIRECIEGVLMQQTTFPVEFIIHDDASTDGTAEIIREYAEKYPEIIIPILQTENQYSKGSGVTIPFVYPRTQGKYIAPCEGDDYWTDPLKLQKQVDYMEAHPDCGLVYTDGRYFYQEKDRCLVRRTREADARTLVAGNVIWTLTTCFRRSLWTDYLRDILPNLPKDLPFGDYQMWIYFAVRSEIKHLPFVSATYRVLSGSASHSRDTQKLISYREKVFEVQTFFINRYFNGEKDLLQKADSAKNCALLQIAVKANDKALYRQLSPLIESLRPVRPKEYRLFCLIRRYHFLMPVYRMLLALRMRLLALNK